MTTCYGCAEIDRTKEHAKGRGQTVNLVAFDPIGPLELDDFED